MYKKFIEKKINEKHDDIKLCGQCGKHITKKSKTKHINIHNNPKVVYFCHYDCKIQWIYQIIQREVLESV